MKQDTITEKLSSTLIARLIGIMLMMFILLSLVLFFPAHTIMLPVLVVASLLFIVIAVMILKDGEH